MSNIKIYFFFIIVFVCLMSSCEEDKYLTSNNIRLEFSNDTICFDTIFNNITTPSKTLMVYNPYNKSLKLSYIKLVGGALSPYKININGSPVSSIENVILYPKDSLYIFIQVNNPEQNTNILSPIIDQLLFNLNGNTYNVQLHSWGQNVVIYRNMTIQSDTFTSEKPYLIYDTFTIDLGHTLVLNAGTKMFFHDNAQMIVKGTLHSNGMLNKPVLLASDRSDNLIPNISYKIVSGKWSGITFENSSNNNRLEYSEIRNTITAIRINNEPDKPSIKIEIKNTKIMHNSYCGIYAKNSSITLTNSVIANSGAHLIRIEGGGNYEFIHCTLANYFELGSIQGETVYLSNTLNKISKDLNIFFGNTVVSDLTGTSIEQNNNKSAKFNIAFKNCFIPLDISKFDTSNSNVFMGKNIFKSNKHNLFIATDNYKYNFSPDSISTLLFNADDSISKLYPKDFYNNQRKNKADIGAIERIKK